MVPGYAILALADIIAKGNAIIHFGAPAGKLLQSCQSPPRGSSADSDALPAAVGRIAARRAESGFATQKKQNCSGEFVKPFKPCAPALLPLQPLPAVAFEGTSPPVWRRGSEWRKRTPGPGCVERVRETTARHGRFPNTEPLAAPGSVSLGPVVHQSRGFRNTGVCCEASVKQRNYGRCTDRVHSGAP